MRHEISEESIRKLAHQKTVMKVAHGVRKSWARENDLELIHSVRTEGDFKDKIEDYLTWRVFHTLQFDGNYRIEEAQEFLDEISEYTSQTNLNNYKRALDIVFEIQLKTVKSLVVTNLCSRSYMSDEVEIIKQHQTLLNSFCTDLCHISGLRAHELFSLRPISEIKPTNVDKSRSDLFIYLSDFKLYTVKGKGGLIRAVAIRCDHAEQLEKFRTAEAGQKTERGTNYQPFYAIGGGHAFTESFSRASKVALKFSNGAHGLRHTYAQNRVKTLIANGINAVDTLEIVSQELGHFRPEVVLTYLR
jgi:integrase